MNEPTHIYILQGTNWHEGKYILAVCATLDEAQAIKDYGDETDMPVYGYSYGYVETSIRSLPIGYRDNLLPKELPCTK
jgi:hypothetical protein